MIKKIFGITICILALALVCYSISGTGWSVDEIQSRAPADLAKRGFTILHGESYEWGAWNYDGGKVWYHVCETANPSMRYRLFVTLWGGELQYTYGSPETMQHIDITYDKK